MTHWRIKSSMATASMFCVLAGSTAWAEQGTSLGRQENVNDLQHELVAANEKLTVRLRELEAALTQQAQAAEGAARETAKESTTKAEKLVTALLKRVTFTGAIKVEALWSRDFEDVSESKVRLNKVESKFILQANEWVKGTLKLEFKSSTDKITVKRAFITVGDTEQFPLVLKAGRGILPVGIEDFLSITDPLPKEVFEADGRDFVSLGVETGGFNAEAYVFNGKTNKNGGAQHLEDHYGAAVGYGIKRGNMAVAARVDFISSVFDSDSLSDTFPEALESRYVPGMAAQVQFFWGGFSIVAEYIAALKKSRFTVDDTEVRIQPKAWAIEGGYITELLRRKTFFALGYSRTAGLAGAFSKGRMLANVGMWVFDSIILTLEYDRDEDYAKADGGTGKSSDAVTLRLTYRW